MTESVAGVILAGGYSRRFGSDKWSHVLRGQPLVSYPSGVLASLSDTVYVLASVRSAPFLEPFGTVIVDVEEGRGPADALLSASHSLPESLLLVLPCDMPYIRQESLRQILSVHVRDTAEATVATDSSGRVQPLVACFNTRALQTITESRSASQPQAGTSMHGLLATLESVCLVELPDSELVNINRPTDLPR